MTCSWQRATRSVRVRLIAVPAIAITILCVICAYLATHIRVSRYYRVRATYEWLPTDDIQLDTWLRMQPGIVGNTVRTERIGKVLNVGFILSQTFSGSPAFPDISRGCDAFGYGPSALG